MFDWSHIYFKSRSILRWREDRDLNWLDRDISTGLHNREGVLLLWSLLWWRVCRLYDYCYVYNADADVCDHALSEEIWLFERLCFEIVNTLFFVSLQNLNIENKKVLWDDFGFWLWCKKQTSHMGRALVCIYVQVGKKEHVQEEVQHTWAKNRLCECWSIILLLWISHA